MLVKGATGDNDLEIQMTCHITGGLKIRYVIPNDELNNEYQVKNKMLHM